MLSVIVVSPHVLPLQSVLSADSYVPEGLGNFCGDTKFSALCNDSNIYTDLSPSSEQNVNVSLSTSE